jgi:threonine synthase
MPRPQSAGLPARHGGILERFRDWLPLTERTPSLGLGEGSTPLVRSRRLEKLIPGVELYFKLESCNPTGSFKDRGMVMAVAKAMEEGAEAILCASTGNTSASAAAYAAHAGLRSYVLVPKGRVAPGKLAQAVVHGARVASIDGNFDDALALAREVADTSSVTLVNSVNPYRIEGQKTAAFEIIEELGDSPDILSIPVGNAGNITAYWKGFVEYYHAERTSRRPRMLGFQAEGAAPLVLGHAVEVPETVATAIRIGNPASGDNALVARDESGGSISAVSDDEIMAAYKLLAVEEGIFAEPASAACVAGVLKLADQRHDFSGQQVVCVITGSGLKDPDVALSGGFAVREVPATAGTIKNLLASED